MHGRALIGVVLRPQSAAVRGDDGPRDGETKAEPLGFGGDEGLEEPVEEVLGYAGTAVADGEQHVLCRVGGHDQREPAVGQGVEL